MNFEITFPLSNIQEAARQFLAYLQDENGQRKANVIAFYGKMGAGKTTFIKALCGELGVSDDVASPTFAIVNEYKGSEPIYHFDFYRIKRMEEFYDMGGEEYLDSGNLCFIEWPELIEPLLPEDALSITIEEQPDGTRRITIPS